MARAVPAVSRALDILELFLRQETATATEIVSALSLPRTTVHELVGTLVDHSFLAVSEGRPTRYRLGARVFQLGGQFAMHLDLAREAQAVAAQIAAACDETVHVAVLDGAEVVYLAKVDSTRAVRMVSAVGQRLPAHCTAVGKVLLSGLAADTLADRYPVGRPLPAMTTRSITSLPRLQSELAAIRRRSLGYDSCESNESVHCIAAPVRDHSDEIIAAVSISVPSPRWNDASRRTWSELITQGAATLSARLGHRSS